MSTPDFFRARLGAMIDLQHPLAVLAQRLPWDRIERALAPKFAHRDRTPRQLSVDDLFGQHQVEFGGGGSNAGWPRPSIRLMASLVYLKNVFNLSDEEVVQRWSKSEQWQFFSGMECYEPRVLCDATAQEGAIAYPVDSRLLGIARHKVVSAARCAGIALRQTFGKEGKELRRKAGGYAEPGHRLSSGQFVLGERLGQWPNTACKATPSSSNGSTACSSGSARSWGWPCEKCNASARQQGSPPTTLWR